MSCLNKALMKLNASTIFFGLSHCPAATNMEFVQKWLQKRTLTHGEGTFPTGTLVSQVFDNIIGS